MLLRHMCVSRLCSAAAVLDSYVCLIHLLAGIVWEGLFNAFATISFTTLILFSILEVSTSALGGCATWAGAWAPRAACFSFLAVSPLCRCA